MTQKGSTIEANLYRGYITVLFTDNIFAHTKLTFYGRELCVEPKISRENVCGLGTATNDVDSHLKVGIEKWHRKLIL